MPHWTLWDPVCSTRHSPQIGVTEDLFRFVCHATFYEGGVTAWVDELLVLEPGPCAVPESVDRSFTLFEHWSNDWKSVLVSLATRGAAAFYEHRGYTAKAGYLTGGSLRLALRRDACVKMCAASFPTSGGRRYRVVVSVGYFYPGHCRSGLIVPVTQSSIVVAAGTCHHHRPLGRQG